LAAGWELLISILQQVFDTKGQVVVRIKKVKRGKAKFADYLFSYPPNVPPGRRSRGG
jgi:hypothetical protein